MILKINFLSGLPAYRQIVEGIREDIALGRLRPMDELPSVRHLALQISVNPNTVARAYRELIQEGTIYSRQGMGFYVRPFEKKDLEFLREGLKKLVIEAKVKSLTRLDVESVYRAVLDEVYGGNYPAQDSAENLTPEGTEEENR
jgi:GntR family transcriptional regulator